MRLELLGPVRVNANGQVTVLRAELERALLASLLLQANRTVPVNHLIDTLWDGEAPRSTRTRRSCTPH